MKGAISNINPPKSFGPARVRLWTRSATRLEKTNSYEGEDSNNDDPDRKERKGSRKPNEKKVAKYVSPFHKMAGEISHLDMFPPEKKEAEDTRHVAS